VSLAFASTAARRSRSHNSSTTLAATEKPQTRAGACAAPCANSHTAASIATTNAATSTHTFISAFLEMHRALTMEVIVNMIEPILTDRAEQIQLEDILERLGLMLDPRRDVQHFAFTDGDFLAADQELQRALQDVHHLL